MNKVIAYQVADSIDLKNVKSSFKSKLRYSDSSELYYETGADRYLYIFRYGVVSFYNFDALAISAFLQFVNSYCRNFFVESINDELIVETGASENKISHNKIEIINADREALRMIMLNV